MTKQRWLAVHLFTHISSNIQHNDDVDINCVLVSMLDEMIEPEVILDSASSKNAKISFLFSR